MTRIMEALAARMDRVRKGDKGFTLIELLVVVIIIGILAAIAIPVYIGVQNNAKDSGVKSDLGNLKTAFISIQTSTGTAPTAPAAGYSNATGGTALTDALKKAGATQGADTVNLKFGKNAADANGFCFIGKSSTSTGADNGFFYATDTLGVSTTACSIG